MKSKNWGLIGICAAALSLNATAFAQTDAPKAKSVDERPRPEFDALGLRFGSFMVYPKLRLGQAYDSNVLANNANKKASGMNFVDTTVDVNSQWSRHALNFQAFSNSRFFYDIDENNSEFGFNGDGRFDVRRFTPLTYTGGWKRGKEKRYSIDAPNAAAEPTTFKAITGGIGIRHKINRLSMGTKFTVQRLNYNDVRAVGGGIIDQDFRDRREYNISSDLGYEFSPGYTSFLRGTYRKANYDLEPTDPQYNPLVDVDRDSKGYRIDGGVRFELTDLLFGEITAGYFGTNFEDPRLTDIHGLALGSSLLWNVTSLTSLRFSLDRDSRPSTSVRIGGRRTTDMSIKVDHELLRNVLLTGRFTYTRDKFEGSTRTDNTYSLGASARYLMNRYMYFQLGADFGTRDSAVNLIDYDRALVELSAVFQL